MADLLIKGMEMSINCESCICHRRMNDPFISQHWCGMTGESIYDPRKKPDWCPFVEMPTPHGRTRHD